MIHFFYDDNITLNFRPRGYTS